MKPGRTFRKSPPKTKLVIFIVPGVLAILLLVIAIASSSDSGPKKQSARTSRRGTAAGLATGSTIPPLPVTVQHKYLTQSDKSLQNEFGLVTATPANDWLSADKPTGTAMLQAHIGSDGNFVAKSREYFKAKLKAAEYKRAYYLARAWFFANALIDTGSRLAWVKAHEPVRTSVPTRHANRRIDLPVRPTVQASNKSASPKGSSGGKSSKGHKSGKKGDGHGGAKGESPSSGKSGVGNPHPTPPKNAKNVAPVGNPGLKQNLIAAGHIYAQSLFNARGSLRMAQNEYQEANRGFAVTSAISPLSGAALSFRTSYGSVYSLATKMMDLATNPNYHIQKADADWKMFSASLTLLSVQAGRDSWAGTLSGGYDLIEKIHEAEETYQAALHQQEAEQLAFGGALSNVDAHELRFAVGDFDRYRGSFYSFDGPRGLSIQGDWNATYHEFKDQFNSVTNYSFDGIKDIDDHMLIGKGTVVRETTVERSTPTSLPFLALFDNNDRVTQTTMRSETYRDTFNGALAEQGIKLHSDDRNPPVAPVSPDHRLPDRPDQLKPKKPDATNPPIKPDPMMAASQSAPAGNDFGGVDFSTLNLRYLRLKGFHAKPVFEARALDKNVDPTKLRKGTQLSADAFHVGLALPSQKFWVNLNPTEPNRIADQDASRTDVARVMLEADLQMKKDGSAITDPRRSNSGKAFWEELGSAGRLGRGSSQVAAETRCWIVPDQIEVMGDQSEFYIVRATLKVRSESEYFSARGSSGRSSLVTSDRLSKKYILPRLTEEVNSAPQYADLRRVYYGLIMAAWYKKYALHGGSLGSEIDSGAVGLHLSRMPWTRVAIWRGYVKSFKEGDYNFAATRSIPGGTVTSHYFSGGVDFTNINIDLRRPIDSRDEKRLTTALNDHTFTENQTFWFSNEAMLAALPLLNDFKRDMMRRMLNNYRRGR